MTNKNKEAVQKTVQLNNLNSDCKDLSSKIGDLTQQVDKMKILNMKQKLLFMVNKVELNLLFPIINKLLKNKVQSKKNEELEIIRKVTFENEANKAKIESLQRRVTNNKNGYDFMKKDFGAKISTLLEEKKKLEKSKEEFCKEKLSIQESIDPNLLSVSNNLAKSSSSTS